MTALSSQNLNMKLIVPVFARNVTFFNFSDYFFDEQLNLEDENRFYRLAKCETCMNFLQYFHTAIRNYLSEKPLIYILFYMVA